MHHFELSTTSVAGTLAAGRRLASAIAPSDVIALSGELGSGKTHLCKGIAEGLGADPDLVNSPTFVLLQQYAGRIPIYHFDTYRLGDVSEFEDLGGIEILDDQGVCLIEWPERIAELLPARTVWIEMTATDLSSRRLGISGSSPRAAAVIAVAGEEQR